MKIQILKQQRRRRRKLHIRKDIFGSNERPRLTIFRSLNNIYAQIVNDIDQKTVVSASNIDKEVKALIKPEMTKVQVSELVGSIIAKRAIEANIKLVAFDRNGFIYHGRVKALADAARKGGLEF